MKFAADRSRDIRAVAYLAVVLILAAAWQFWPAGDSTSVAAASSGQIELAEQQLERLRSIAASVPGKRQVLTQVTEALAQREEALITAETGAQAQAEIIQILRRVGSEESPGIQINATQLGNLKPLGEDYGAAPVTIQMDCHIEQLINFLAAVAQLPELISPESLSIDSSDASSKMLRVRLTLTGVVPGSLLPVQEGEGA